MYNKIVNCLHFRNSIVSKAISFTRIAVVNNSYWTKPRPRHGRLSSLQILRRAFEVRRKNMIEKEKNAT